MGAFLGISFVIILCAILYAVWLSCIDRSLNSLSFNDSEERSRSYYEGNPLWRNGSKWFHYRPTGWVIMSPDKWNKILAGVNAIIATERHSAYRQAKQDMLADIRSGIIPIELTKPTGPTK